MALIHEQIIKVMSEVGGIEKNRKNTGQGYNFRGIDDVYNTFQPILAKHGIFMVPRVLADKHEERATKSGGNAIYRILTIEYTIFASDGSFIQAVVIGEGMDSGDKASNKAMSVAQKYVVLQVFAVPTQDQKDPENDNHEVIPKQHQPKASTLNLGNSGTYGTQVSPPFTNTNYNPGDYVINFGTKFKGKQLRAIDEKDLRSFSDWIRAMDRPNQSATDTANAIDMYLAMSKVVPNEQIPF